MSSQNSQSHAAAALAFVRAALLFVLFVELLGIGGELVLLEHYEGIWQKIPLILITTTLVVLVAHLIVRRRVSVHLVRLAMLLCMAGGAVGLYLHYDGNAEFELEMYPSLEGMELFWESIHGATPALAPGALVQLGLLGLIYTFRHPACQRADAATQTDGDQK